MLPPGTSPTTPDRIRESFNTFDVNLALMHSVMDLFDIRLGLRLQSPLGQEQLNNHRISPSLGMLYVFLKSINSTLIEQAAPPRIERSSHIAISIPLRQTTRSK